MKKIFYILFILILSILLSFLLIYDNQIIIYINNYEVITNTKILFLLCFLLFTFGYFISSLINIIKKVNKKRLLNKINNEKNKFITYLDNIFEAYLYSLADNFTAAYKKIDKANKYTKHNLTELIKFQILYKEQKYEDSINIIKKIGKNKNLNELINNIINNINLSEAIKNNNKEDIKKIYANNTFNIQKNNIAYKNILYNIYKGENDWKKCLEFIEEIKKTLTKQEYKNELFLINKNLSEFYFNNRDYNNSLKYSLKVFNINKNIYENNKIIINSLKKINSNKLNKFIEKIWKYTPKNEFGYLYIDKVKNNKKLELKLAKKLFKFNKNNIHSVIFYTNVLIKNNKFELIDNNIINILNLYKYKEIFEILLKIEEKNKKNSFLISNLKEKIINSKSINEC